MQQILLMPYDTKIEELSVQLGFTNILFLERDVILIDLSSKKKVLSLISQAKSSGILTVAKPESEDMLRFLLEKTAIDIVFGLELIHPKEHYHYLRAGLDHVLAKIAKKKGKIIGISLSDMLKSTKRAKILARVMQNISICRKFDVKMCFLSTSVHSAQEVHALSTILTADMSKK